MSRQHRNHWLDRHAVVIATAALGLVACGEDASVPPGETGGTTAAGGVNQGAGGASAMSGGSTSSGGLNGGTSAGGAVSSMGGSNGGGAPAGGSSSGGASNGGTSNGGTSGSGASSGGAAGQRPVSTALPYREDFEDGAANGWMAGYDDEMMPLGKWSVVDEAGGKVFQAQEATSDPSWAVGGDYRWTDQHLEAKVKFVSGAADGLVTLVVRFTTFKTYCFVEVRDNQMKLRVKADGSTTDLGTYKFMTPLADGTWYTIGLSAKGSALEAYFDGMMVASGMNATVTAGGIALTATDAVVSFDDVVVTSP
jgi:hypothetical protein